MSNVLGKILKNNNFLSLANNGVVAIFGLLGFLLLARSLNTNDFGKWVLLIATVNFANMLRFGITGPAIIRFLAGADPEKAGQLIGSNYLINLITSALIVGIVIIFNFIFPSKIAASGFSLFFQWFPLLAFINLPFNNAQAILQAKVRFDRLLVLRSINVGGFMLFLLFNYFWFRFALKDIVYAYLLINFITSLIASLTNWDGISHILKAKRATNKLILDFGKYSTGTLIGSNLLKSADTFIIGLSPFLGTVGVAFYSIPLKLTQIIELPLQSYAMTAFPRMSKASIEGDNIKMREIFYTNVGGITLLLIPIMVLSFIFAKDLVYIIGGPDYVSTAVIFRIFCIYGLLLPLDRFIGVALDSINLPKYNFFKVIYMTSANIIGDFIVVFAFLYVASTLSTFTFLFSGIHEPHLVALYSREFTIIAVLKGVAWVTILFTLVGIFVGYHYLRQNTDIHLRKIFKGSIRFFTQSMFFKKNSSLED